MLCWNKTITTINSTECESEIRHWKEFNIWKVAIYSHSVRQLKRPMRLKKKTSISCHKRDAYVAHGYQHEIDLILINIIFYTHLQSNGHRIVLHEIECRARFHSGHWIQFICFILDSMDELFLYVGVAIKMHDCAVEFIWIPVISQLGNSFHRSVGWFEYGSYEDRNENENETSP